MKKWVGIAFLLTLLQVLLLLVLAPHAGSLSGTYLKLNNWDSFHYEQIADTGYRMPVGRPVQSDDIHAGLANVVFFPGYPLAVRAVNRGLGIPIPFALLVVSQLACWLFWLYFLLLLERWGVSRKWTLWSLFAVWIFPSAFFLTAGYTESLFLAGFLGFLYWSERWTDQGQERLSPAWAAAALHGGVMSATRIVSFAATIYPVLLQWEVPRSARAVGSWLWRRRWAILLGVAAILPAFAFFAYCKVHFGNWNLYFKLEEVGWDNQKRWFALLDPMSYIPRFFFEDTVTSFNRLSVPVIMGLFVAAAVWERTRKATRRWAAYLVAFVLFYIPVTGKANAHMDSMIRYSFPVFVILVLCLAQLFTERERERENERQSTRKQESWQKQLQQQGQDKPGELEEDSGALALQGNAAQGLSLKAKCLLVSVIIFSLGMQIWFAMRFLRGRWVA